MPLYSSGTGLSTSDRSVLDVLSIKDETILKSKLAFETTLDSLYFEEQHVLSSTGENMMTINTSSGVNFFPVWQAVTENQNYSSTERVYSALQTSSYSEGTNYVPFRELYPNVDASSIWRFNLKSGQVLEAGSYLTYSVFYYNGSQSDVVGSSAFDTNLGNRIYRQVIKLPNRIDIGDTFEIVFESPVEVHAGQVIYDEITVGMDSQSANYFLAKESTVPNVFYQEVKFKTFTDVPIAKLSDVAAVAGGAVYRGAYNADTNTPTLPTGSDANGDTYRVSVSGNGKEVGDLLIYNSASTVHDHIPVKAVTQEGIEQSSLKTFDWYVKPDYVGATQTGSAYTPFIDIQSAINSAADGDSIFIDGDCVVTQKISIDPTKSLTFQGVKDRTKVRYGTYSNSNDHVFHQENSSCTKTYRFLDLEVSNSGGYGIYIRSAKRVEINNNNLKNNCWNGTGLHTVVDTATSGVAGFDSTQAELQAFKDSANMSTAGGAVRLREVTEVIAVDNDVSENLRSLRFQDCGIGGFGFVSRNNTFKNIESGIYLASDSYNATDGCENFVVYNNAAKYNANNGILCIGGYNNVIALNHIEGNWNAGAMPWHVSNTIVRDSYLLNNNRSAFNGIGNTGDAGASLEIAGGTIRSTAKFIAHVLNNQIVDTGLGNSTTSNGLRISSSLDSIGDRDKAVILLDNNTMQGQDYSYLEECDLDEIRLIKGDNTYIDSAIQDTKTLGTGDYYELPYSNQHTNATTLDLSLDATGSQIGVKDADGRIINYYGINQLHAVDFGSKVRIKLKASNKIQFDDVPTTGISIDGVAVTGTIAEVVNSINALVQSTGTSSGSIPSITSSLAVSIVEGDTLNYELTADFGVGYEWDLSNVSGVAVVAGNPRKLIGGSGLAVGSYNIPVKAINYNGEDTETLVLTVSTPAFANTKSVNFANQDYLGANAGLLANTLGRTGNGSGSSDAWTIAMWYKGSTNLQGQTIFYYGGADTTNKGHISLVQVNQSGVKHLRLRYGHSFNRIQLQTPGITPNTWQHILVSYDGGTTGSASGSLSNYYSRFKIYIDGVLTTPNTTHVNFGYSNDIDADNFRVGRYSSGNYMRDCRVDELAIFNSDQSANISDLYNGGSTFDLDTLTNKPNHWWRMGDGDTYPYLQDSGTSGNCVFQMYNMTAADIVSDTP